MFLPKCKVYESSNFAAFFFFAFLKKKQVRKILFLYAFLQKNPTKTEPTNGSKEQSFLALWDMQKHVL